jgi:DNA-binding SARP family transcriptional activator/tetratricopeptide (TPR) repeat protein
VLVVSDVDGVELRLAGTFGVLRDGSELPGGEVGSRKARVLLKLLAVERPALVSLDRIVEVLWPDDPPAAAQQNVATLVSRLRKTLGHSVIVGSGQGYRLAREPTVTVDLDVAARLCEQAERKLGTAAGVALAAAERSVVLLAAGTALADEPYAVWADVARAQLREQLRRARLLAAEAALAVGRADGSLRYAQSAMTDDPLDEAAHRWYMSAAAAAGEPARALAAYTALRRRLRDELGVEPARPTQQLHLAILRSQDGHWSGDSGAQSLPSPPRPSVRPALPLAGRDGELATLLGAWARAAGGESGLVVIAGEAGIGKTTLAGALAAEAGGGGATVLSTRCYEAERSLFLQPMVDAIAPVVAGMPAEAARALLGEHAPVMSALLPDATDLLGAPTGWHGSPEMERRRAFEAVTAFLTGLAAVNPVLLLVDDLQYAGQSSVELIHYLARRAGAIRLLTVATVRAENEVEIGRVLSPVAARVELGPLSAAAVGQLARQAGQAGLADSIMERTRGHTLFVVEVLRTLAAGEVGVPESLRNAVLGRVERAGQRTGVLLRAAAVLGASLDPLALSALLDLTPSAAVELCSAAVEARLVVVSGRDYEFANDLIREVLYATTPEPTRLAYHRRAADLLTGQPEAVARHAAAAGDWPRAARAWLLAAENAMHRYAASDAAALATQALEIAERCQDIEVAARATFVRGRAHDAQGAQDAALADMTRAVASAKVSGDRRLEMLILRELGGDVPAALGGPSAAYAANLERGLQIAESLGDRAAEADILSRQAILAVNRLRFQDALADSVHAVAVGRAAKNEQALVAALDSLKTVHGGLGDVGGLRAVADELGPLVRRLGDLLKLQWFDFESAFVCVAAADWDGAARAIQAGIDVNIRGGYPHSMAWYVAHLGWLARLRGRDAEAVSLGRQALKVTDRYPHSWWRAAACALLGGTLLVTGDTAEAITLFEQGLAVAERAEVEAYMLRCAAPLAAATGSKVMLAEAARLLDAATFPDGGAWILGDECYLAIARAWLAQHEPDRARAVLAPLLAVAERVPWRATHAATLVVDGQALHSLGQGEAARAALLTAARLAAEFSLPHVQREATAALADLR